MAIPEECLNNALLKMAQWSIFLEFSVENGGMIFGGFINENEKRRPTATEKITNHPIEEQPIIQVLNSLKEWERKILEPPSSRHKGLMSKYARRERQTIQKSREQIRQIKDKALWNLCHPKPLIKRIPRIFERRAIEFPL